MEMDVNVIWDTIRRTVGEVEAGRGDFEINAVTLETAVVLLFSFPPAEIYRVVEASDLPTRAAATWLVFEARKVRDLDQNSVAAFADYYRQAAGQDLLPMPQSNAGPMRVI
jgi:hypothetical protein